MLRLSANCMIGRNTGHFPKIRDILHETSEVKYVFIERYQAELHIKA